MNTAKLKLAIVLSFILIPSLVHAANRTVCFELEFRDDRYDCATAADTGEQRACTSTYTDLVGGIVQVWDKDAGGGDEYIGAWSLSAGGEQCLTFPWEGESYQLGETHPDVYLKYTNQVRRTSGGNPVIKGVQDDGSDYPFWSWRLTDGDNTFTAVDCASGSSCRIYSAGAMAPTTSASTNASMVIQALDSAQHTLERFGGIMYGGTIELELPDSSGICTSGCALGFYSIGIPSTRGKDGDLTPHEVGHVIQMQEFNQGTLRNDCSNDGDGWSITSDEYDSCATTEGFASYVAAASLWNATTPNADPRFSGFDIELATPVSGTRANNRGVPGQVARAFWDLDDETDENSVSPCSGDDDHAISAVSATWLAQQWDDFPDGTGDGDDFESGIHGVNMKDYQGNAGTNTQTTLDHNCLNDQDG